MGDIRIKTRKAKEKTFYIRMVSAWLLMLATLFAIYMLTGGAMLTFRHVMVFSLFCIPLALLYSVAVERLGSFLGVFLSGWSSRKVSLRETILADLGRARFSKMKGAYDEAYNILTSILDKIPGSPDALFLMAQVQWEGFGNYSDAKKCLQKIMHIVPSEETLHQWASSYYDEIMRDEKRKYIVTNKEED
ncbi:tetratricopeptide repeat protein [Thermodesulfobacteriota bacterium]